MKDHLISSLRQKGSNQFQAKDTLAVKDYETPPDEIFPEDLPPEEMPPDVVPPLEEPPYEEPPVKP